MTPGVGGSSFAAELAAMADRTAGCIPISPAEYESRIAQAQSLLRAQGTAALYLDASTNLSYFTGLQTHPSERLHGAIIPASGPIAFLTPAFEEPKTRSSLAQGADIRTWHEHEDPTALVIETIRGMGHSEGAIAIDPATPFQTTDGLRRAGNSFTLTLATPITSACRQIKSPAEIALMQTAMNISLEVQKATARCLRTGVTTTEILDFIAQAHRALGAKPGFAAAQFGEATAYPHGVPHPQTLADGDMVLIDLGCILHGYWSDITRTYVFGTPTPRQREIWTIEHRAQAAGFRAARLGASCEQVDAAARSVIEAAGYGPGYATPGLPHRTGHGLGTDLHEHPYIVKGNQTRLAPGMCFSIEPMLCLYGECGVRLEDIVHMTDEGPRWFIPPSPSIDDPFGLAASGL